MLFRSFFVKSRTIFRACKSQCTIPAACTVFRPSTSAWIMLGILSIKPLILAILARGPESYLQQGKTLLLLSPASLSHIDSGSPYKACSKTYYACYPHCTMEKMLPMEALLCGKCSELGFRALFASKPPSCTQPTSHYWCPCTAL